jgi:hypothetical protein
MDGVVVEVWWGLGEGRAPHKYTWDAYAAIFDMLDAVGLKARVCAPQQPACLAGLCSCKQHLFYSAARSLLLQG